MKSITSRRNLPVIALVAFLLVAGVTALVSYTNTNRSLAELKMPSIGNTGGKALTTSAPALGTTAEPGVVISGTTASAAAPEILPAPYPWTGRSRVTVLVMGLDYRDWEDNQGPPRTDTMMLLTIDPVTMTAGMVSIPRDLWVDVPGFGNRKINVAYRFGELYKLPGGGPALAEKTVEGLLGVPIDYYAQIDFFAFERFIDEIGGIQVDVPEEIKVDPIGPGNTVILQPGIQTLDGPTALGYARNRHTAGGDFDRAERQQQVILAVRDRVLSLNALPRLVLRAPQLYAELNAGIHTDLSLNQIIQLAWLAQQVPADKINRAAIGPHETAEARAEDNQAILEPNISAIRILRDKIFSTDLSAIKAQGDELKALASQENASIRVIDSSGKEDLGTATVQYLRDLGLAGVQDSKVRSSVNSTKVTDYTGNPYTLKYLVEVLKIDPRYITNAYVPNSPVDLEVILGADWARENNLP